MRMFASDTIFMDSAAPESGCKSRQIGLLRCLGHYEGRDTITPIHYSVHGALHVAGAGDFEAGDGYLFERSAAG